MQNALKQSGGQAAPWGSSTSGTGVENKVIHVLPKVNTTKPDGYFIVSGPGSSYCGGKETQVDLSGPNSAKITTERKSLLAGKYKVNIHSNNFTFKGFRIIDENMGTNKCFSSGFNYSFNGTKCTQLNACTTAFPSGQCMGMLQDIYSYEFIKNGIYRIELLEVNCN